jgi:hypothetical protein
MFKIREYSIKRRMYSYIRDSNGDKQYNSIGVGTYIFRSVSSMQLEIGDYYANEVYTGSNGFTIIVSIGLIISALKTDEGLYVAEKDLKNGEFPLVLKFSNQLEVLACVATWLPEEDMEVLRG